MSAKRPSAKSQRERDLARELAYAQGLIAYRVAVNTCDPFPPRLRAMLAVRGINVDGVAQAVLADAWAALARLGEASVERMRAIEQGESITPAKTPRKRAALKVVSLREVGAD